MANFKDNSGREWDVAINVATVKRVKDLLGVNLFALLSDRLKGLGELLADPVRFVDVLYVIVKPQADAAGVTDEQFGGSLGGDTLQAAAEAFLEALGAFMPTVAGREALRAVLEKGRQALDLLGARTTAAVAALDAEALVKEMLEKRAAAPAAAPADGAQTPAG